MSEPDSDGIVLSGSGFDFDAAAPAAAPARPARATTPNQVLAIVCVGMVLANIDLFIVNVGLPNIARDLGSHSLEDLSWVLNGYAITYAALLVFFGRWAERHRRDRSFMLGVAVFTIASAACSIADSVAALVAYRVLQAAGAALMTPTSIGLLLATFPPERRGHAVRTWTAIGGLAAALGPVVGGALLEFSWRWIFLVNVPIGAVALLIGWWKLPAVPGHDAPRPTLWPAILITGGIAAVTLAIVKVNDWGWTAPATIASFAGAAICLALFVVHCLRAENPFVNPAMFKIRQYTGAALVMAPYSAAFGAMLLSTVLWEQTEWGWSALKTGAAIAIGPLLVPTTSLLFGTKLIVRFGAARVIVAGIAFFAIGMIAWATLLGTEPNLFVAILTMAPVGIGVGLTFPTVMGVGTSALPSSMFATGSGAINMIRQSALAIGVAIFVAMVGSPADPIARMNAYDRGWWVMAGIIALGLIPTFVLIRKKRAA
ncbi:MAG TPA: MFS transporter [Magnetospirillaceae bacterium]